MKVILLLAGRSQRFWPLKEKTLFPICGRTLLEHQLARLEVAGIKEKDVLLVGGKHNLEDTKKLLPKMQTVEQENLELGMRGALLSALPQCKGEPVLIVSGNDVIAAEGYAAVLKAGSAKGVAGALLAQQVKSYFPGGYIQLKGDRIVTIIEKPGEGKEPSDLVNIVAHLHNDSAALLDALQDVDESKDDGYEQALQKLFDTQEYRAVAYTGLWQAVKYPWHMVQLLPVFLNEITKQSIHKTAKIHPTAVIDGNVILDEGVKVMPHATVVGPCYIGKHSIVANNALVRQASVGDHCVVGYSTEVKSSLLHSHVWTHMSYVGDSVIGRNVSFGGGSKTGNLRLDEQPITSVVKGEKINTNLVKFGSAIGDDVRLGISVNINPGVKIGSSSFVSSGVTLSEDVPEKNFARMKGGVVHISENSASVPQPEARDDFLRSVKT